MTSPSYAPSLPYRIVTSLDTGDLRGAFRLMRPVSGYALKRLNFELAVLAAPAPGIVTVGLSTLVWGNPYRGTGHAWRCGDCPWTGTGYESAKAAMNEARAHITDGHAQGDRPELCEITPNNSLHARMTTLLYIS